MAFEVHVYCLPVHMLTRVQLKSEANKLIKDALQMLLAMLGLYYVHSIIPQVKHKRGDKDISLCLYHWGRNYALTGYMQRSKMPLCQDLQYVEKK